MVGDLPIATAQLRLGGAHATVFPLTQVTSPDLPSDNTNTLNIITAAAGIITRLVWVWI
ncbi:MAG TPA: hypothetical protein VK335_33745 [Bryobacteraceae bacterium]|nr:hypothetical protein [Bryobacteraceae bacterium]